MANNNFSTTSIKNVAWMREIQVILTSSQMKSKFVFDNNYHINISGKKYLSLLKDTFTVNIDNVPYDLQVRLIAGKFFEVEIKAGYRTSGLYTVYKGYVLYMSNNLGDRKTSNFIILCTSKLVAIFGQTRMNIGLKSGINMYSALKYIFKKAGLTNAKVDRDFKYKILNESTHINATLGSYVDQFIGNYGYLANTDESLGNTIDIWNPIRKDARMIFLNQQNILFTGSYPTLTSDGLNLTCVPSITYMAGDTIVIDNALIQISADSKSEVYENKSYYLDEKGRYMIFELDYELDNRGSSFNVRMLCKTRGLIGRIVQNEQQ